MLDHWEMDFDLCESSAELPQKTRNIRLQNPHFCELFEAKTGTFETENEVPLNCRRMPQKAAELPQSSATHSPKKCKTDQLLPDCVQKKHFSQFAQNFGKFSRSKKMAPKVSDQLQTRLPAQFPKDTGAALALLW